MTERDRPNETQGCCDRPYARLCTINESFFQQERPRPSARRLLNGPEIDDRRCFYVPHGRF